MRPSRYRFLFTPRGVLDRFALAGKAVLGSAYRIIGVVVMIAGLWTLIVATGSPDVELAWVDDSQASPVISDLGRDEFIRVGLSDLYRRRIHVPLQLAIRNKGWMPLGDVVIQLSYPRLSVETSADRLASRDSATILEHRVGSLAPGGAYTPLRDVDQLVIPVDPLLTGAMTIDRHKFPQYVEFLKEWGSTRDTGDVRIRLEARITAAGRLRAQVLTLTVPVWAEQRAWWPPAMPFSEAAATLKDRAIFDSMFSRARDTIFAGSFVMRRLEGRLRYVCLRVGAGRALGYWVQGRLVRVMADTSGRWLVDLDLILRDDGRLVRRTYAGPRPLDTPFVPSSMRPALPGEIGGPTGVIRLRR
jgi:hypothetical protein